MYLTRINKNIKTYLTSDLTFQTSNPAVLTFFTSDGKQVESITNGKVYFIAVGNNFLKLENRRVFLYLPPDADYKSYSNLAGYFFVSGKTIPESRMIWKSLLDRYYLEPSPAETWFNFFTNLKWKN